MCATTFMLLLDISIVVVALPSIQRRFGAGLSGLQWTLDAYALTLAVLILTCGALADRYGRRLVFLIGVIVFTSASALCGAAWSITVLDLARALQGVGGAALFATALALIGHEYRGVERFGALAIWGATVGAAVASGPLIGGILTDTAGWRWVFYVNVPIGIFALFLALTRMSESRDVDARRTDVAGLVSFSAALFLIVFGILRGNAHGWTSGLILGALIGGALLLVAFVVIERRQKRPMLDITLFGQPAFAGVSIATFCIAAGMFALFPYLSIYFQDILGYSPLGAGLRFLPMTAFVFFVPLIVRRFAARVPMRTLIGAGLALVAVGLALDVGPALADLALDGASSRAHHRRDRDRDRQPGTRGRGAACRRPGSNGDGVRDQQHLPHRRRRPRHRGARRSPREPDRGLALHDPRKLGARPCERGQRLGRPSVPEPARPRACGHRSVRRRPRRPAPDRRDRARGRCRLRLHAAARASPGRGSRDGARGLGRLWCVRPRREA